MKRQPFKLLGVASSPGLFVGIVAALVVLAGSTGRADEQVVRLQRALNHHTANAAAGK